MMNLLFLLSIQYFSEDFRGAAPSKSWSSLGPAKDYSYGPCSASHEQYPSFCLKTCSNDTFVLLKGQLPNIAANAPIFAFFTVKSTPHDIKASISLRLLSGDASVYTFSIDFDGEWPRWFFNFSSTEISSGNIEWEPYLTHSFAFSQKASGNFTIFIDGMSVADGSIPLSATDLSHVAVVISSESSSVEVGHILVSDDESERWPMTIGSILRYRQIERSAYFKSIVDDEEIRLFGEALEEPLEKEDELLSAKEADPRHFAFPFTIPKKKRKLTEEEAYGTPEGVQERLEKDTAEVREIEEFEEEEREFAKVEL